MTHTYENPPLNHTNDVIELDEYQYNPNGDGAEDKWMGCQVCHDEIGVAGLIIPHRVTKPPYTIRHDLHCVLCGQRYHFKSLGIELEKQNEQFQTYWAAAGDKNAKS